MAKMVMTIEYETRLCEVNGEIGFFHTWEHWAHVVDASLLRGGHPGGQISKIYGIVEFANGVRRVEPSIIKFCDEKNAVLKEMNKMKGESNVHCQEKKH